MFSLILVLLILLIPHSITAQIPTSSDAHHHLEEADVAFAQGETDGPIEKFKQAIQEFEEVGDRSGIATAKFRLGRTYRRVAKFSEATNLLQEALKLHEEMGDKTGMGFDLTELAVTQQRQGNYDEAITLSEKALVIHKEVNNQEGIARTLENFGNIYFRKGELEKAVNFFQQALSAATEINNQEVQSIILTNLGQVYIVNGDYPTASECLNQAYKIAKERSDLRLLGAISGNRSLIFWNQGNEQAALKQIEEGLPILHKIGNRQHEAVSYLNIGTLQLELGNYFKSQEAYNQSLAMAKELNDKGLTATVLNGLADLNLDLANYEAASDYVERSLKLSRETGEQREIGTSLRQLGNIEEKRGNYARALEYFHKSLRVYERMNARRQIGSTLHEIGIAYAKLGNYEQALKSHQRALQIRESIGERTAIGQSTTMIGSTYLSQGKVAQADAVLTKAIQLLQNEGTRQALWPALYNKGLVCRKMGKPEEAIDWLKQAADVIERIRSEVELPEQKSGYLENKLDVYENLVALLVKSHDDGRAFEYIERSKARAFLDLLSETKIDPQSNLTSEKYEKKRMLTAQLMDITRKIMEEAEKEQADPKNLAELKKTETRLEEDYSNFLIEIRKQNPNYAELHYPQPLKLSEAQALLDPNSALIDYFLGKKESLLLVVTSNSSQAFILPVEQKIYAQVKELLEVMQKPEPVWQTSTQSYTRYAKVAYQLYRELLHPAEELIRYKERIIIAPDGPLHYLPFEALLAKGVSSPIDFSKLAYLGSDYEIQYVPSVSVLSLLRQNAHKINQDRKQLIAFADPLQKGKPLSENPVGVVRAWSKSMTELPYARVEVDRISKLYPADQVRILIGQDATESNVKTVSLNEYRIVHFASHGFIDEERPQLSALIMNPGDQQEDGYLTMREVFDLKLDADLVVLSACKSGLGRQIRGEGLSGLSRAFFSAGTSSVVVSLWNVYDPSTAEFMMSFYGALKDSGSDKAAAMKDARMKMIRDKKYSHPFYWAPFILVGTN